MSVELSLRFPSPNQVVVRLGELESGAQPFASPLTDKDHRDLTWYVETYGAHSLGDPDDAEAKRISQSLPEWGKSLFRAAFQHAPARRLFNRFQDAESETRLLTISAEHPTILALPWELLHDPDGQYLFSETPRISIRRSVAGTTGGRLPFNVTPRDRLHLLFVVSRPTGAGFIDPRADAGAVLDALDEHAPGRVTWEFLRPPTLEALVERLEARDRPAVDIVHFDGHGVFDRQGGLPGRIAAKHGHPSVPRSVEELLKEEEGKSAAGCDGEPNTGYLLFETHDGQPDLVPADKLGMNLHRHKVALAILSACQSAMVGEDDTGDRPMGSVAARLTATGIPAVLAMTHSVLVPTTKALFGAFYKDLAKQRGLGEALDNARRHVLNNPRKYQVQRGPKRAWLVLQDWFLPALYQAGRDVPLLTPAPTPTPAGLAPPAMDRACGNLPAAPEEGFFGRRKELWEIERWLAGKTRRITVTGFGGQGKTALALEAGRWLVRTGLFQTAALVDYSRIQARDAVAVAVNAIGSVLGVTLLDASATTEALRATPTLVILDNLEALDAATLQALLDAAVGWSEAGGSRVLCTTRTPELGHAQYRVEGTVVHRRIPLDGLGSLHRPDDALHWFAELTRLPPAPEVPAPSRDELKALFEQVRFHPLSIRVLTQQLKTRSAGELGRRLGELLAGASASDRAAMGEDTPAGLMASLQLSLDRLDDEARRVLPRLGVFQGGAFEDDLLAITGLAESGERARLEKMLAAAEAGELGVLLQAMGVPAGAEAPAETLAELQAQLPELAAGLRKKLAGLPLPPPADLWPRLRGQLEAAALIVPESVPGVGVPFLRFHPTLAPLLWAQLDGTSRAGLSTAHHRRYYALAKYLYRADDRTPQQARAIALREMPNLLHAVHAALDVGEPDGVDFADSVNLFLVFFGFRQEAEALSTRAQSAAGEAGSRAWFLAQSNRGEQTLAAGQVAAAAQVFQTILQQLGKAPSYERAVTLARLGRCFRGGGRPGLAEEAQRDALTVLEALEPSDGVERQRGVCLIHLADVLRDQGQYAQARDAYQKSLAAMQGLSDERSVGAVLGQLGTLAMLEGNLVEAAERFREALSLFQRLGEPRMEATAWHQLGLALQEARQWDEAERHYRESARIKEAQGNLAGANGAATTWNQLANVCKNAGKPQAAESWYRKAIDVYRALGNAKDLAPCLNNLAILLQALPGRLEDARRLAEEALAIGRTLEPGAARIWTTHTLLAQIADREAAATDDPTRRSSLEAEAGDQRRQARAAQRAFPGTRHALKRHAPLILSTVMAAHDPSQRALLDDVLKRYTDPSCRELVAAIHRIVAGERDEETLHAGQFGDSPMILDAILQGLADPSTLQDLLPNAPSK